MLTSILSYGIGTLIAFAIVLVDLIHGRRPVEPRSTEKFC